MMVLFVICRLVPEGLVGVFNKDPAVLAVGGEYLKIVAWNFVPSGIVFVSSSMFQALGNTIPSLVSSFVRTSLLVIPAILMSRAAGFALHWIWYLSVGCVAFHALMNLLLLRREYGRKLAFASPVAAPLAAAQ
jgi:Na+-driven multidrug efflux pump